jgi:hypothetical protein
VVTVLAELLIRPTTLVTIGKRGWLNIQWGMVAAWAAAFALEAAIAALAHCGASSDGENWPS